MKSAPPPAGKGTTSRIGFSGYAAEALAAAISSPPKDSARSARLERFIDSAPVTLAS
jgi:hypothetical protein